MKRDSDDLRAYLNNIGRHPLMTPAEEISCGKAIQAARELRELDRPLTSQEQRIIKRGERAKQRFITGNLRLVVSVAKRYTHLCDFMLMSDLIQEGSIGLMRATELFDPSRGYKFSTYCYWWIRQGITRAMNNQERSIRRPSSVCELGARMKKAVIAETVRLGRPPTRAELAAASRTSVAEIETYIERACNTTSLDAIISNTEETSFGQCVADPVSLEDDKFTDEFDIDFQGPVFKACLLRLSDVERISVEMRYGLDGKEPRTLKQIGEHVHLSRERVRQLIDRSMVKLRIDLVKQGMGPGGSRRATAANAGPVARSDASCASQSARRPRSVSAEAPAQRCDAWPSSAPIAA